MDQDGELFNHPEVLNLFKKKGYDILPTGADSNAHQNCPVEQGHCTLTNTIGAFLLVGTKLNTKFWSHDFYHTLRMSNALPERGTSQSPVSLATGKQEKFSNIQTFGCLVWVCPPGHCNAKLNLICLRVCSLDMFPIPLKTYHGMTQKHPRLKLQHMLILTREQMISQSLKCLQMLLTLSAQMMDNLSWCRVLLS